MGRLLESRFNDAFDHFDINKDKLIEVDKYLNSRLLMVMPTLAQVSKWKRKVESRLIKKESKQ